MNETQLKCFYYACEHLNFTEAAARVFITQPALSRNIARLEDELGFQLFVRDVRHKCVRLSPAGTVFYEGLRSLKGHFEALVAESKRADRGESGTLKLGIFEDEYIDETLQGAIFEFSERYPDVELILKKVGYEGLVNGLLEDDFDIIFTLELDVQNQAEIVYDDMYYIPVRLAMHKSHPLAERSDLSLFDFRDETFIVFPNEVAGRLNDLLMKTCGAAGFVPNTIVASDLKTQLLWIEIGRGIAGVSGRSYIANSPTIKMMQIADMKDVMYVRAWKRENYNPAIALFNSVMDL